MKQKFEITNETKNDMVNAIKKHFSQERNEDLGELAAVLILDFFMDELAPKFYNQGVEDAHAYITQKLDDIYEIEK